MKATAATIGISSIPVGVSAESTPEPVGVKGTRRQPVKQKHIDNARTQALDGIENGASETDQIVLASDPTPEEGYLAGYALVVKNGAPIERIFRVSEPQPIAEIRGESKQSLQQASTHSARSKRPAETQGKSPGDYRKQQERNAHESIEQFLAENGGK
ncbi:hypothetical protein [Halorhabdus sp. BNX81]|uniref:hypothetical protein n=1 Tax=Halorhabdus sp. BNX81 TaxID=2980181 RepID=UPI0023DD5E6C|nr:hypothetical protein [Halorhabdus sp. BNX81]